MNRMPALTDPSQQNSSDHVLVNPGAGNAAAMNPPLRLGVMASGNGTNFEALARAMSAGRLSAEIRLLVVNNPGCGAEQRAEALGIACAVVDHRCFDRREALDRELVRRFQAAEVEAVVMAGWMRIVTAELIQAFPGRLMNIHPSLLPSFRGLDGVGQALQAGVRISGCTVHLVTEELDAGPVIMQAAVPVHAEDDHDSLARRIQQQEHRILPEAVMLAAHGWRQG